MKDYLLFQMHIMWYEYKIVREGLDSLQRTIENSNIDVKINLCLNEIIINLPIYVLKIHIPIDTYLNY